MNLKQLSKEVSKRRGTRNEAETYKILVTATKIIIESILKGHIVKLVNFASFRLEVVNGRTYDNLNVPGGKIEVPRRFKLCTTVSRTFKKKIHAKKAY